MTHSLKKHSSDCSNSNMTRIGSPAPAGLGINRDSRVISKVQPKIRIIHIFAPEIINTDVENFRELVQRLTGMPSSSSSSLPGKGDGGSRRKSTAGGPSRASMRKNIMIKSDMDHAYGHDHQQQPGMISMLSERPTMMMTTTPNRDDGDRHHHQQQQHQHAHVENNIGNDHNNIISGAMSNNMWRVPSAGDHHHQQQGSTTEFLNAFQDLDGFIQEFGSEFPYVSASDGTNPHLATFGETHQLSYRG